MIRFFLLITLLSVVSCASLQSNDMDKVVSENTVLKRKTSQLERENGVIRRENNENLALIKTREAMLEKIDLDFKAFKKKYDADMTLLTNTFENYKKRSELQQKEDQGKIKLLTDQNLVLEKTLAERVKALNDELRKNTELYNAEREKMKTDAVKREAALQKTIDTLHINLESQILESNEFKDEVIRLKKELAEKNAVSPTAAPAQPTPSSNPVKE